MTGLQLEIWRELPDQRVRLGVAGRHRVPDIGALDQLAAWTPAQVAGPRSMDPQVCAPFLRSRLKKYVQDWPGGTGRGLRCTRPAPTLRTYAYPARVPRLVTAAYRTCKPLLSTRRRGRSRPGMPAMVAGPTVHSTTAVMHAATAARAAQKFC